MMDFDCTLPSTRAYCILGTPNYMSPEQMLWSPDVDLRTDVFSMGVVLFELLIGVTPRKLNLQLLHVPSKKDEKTQLASHGPASFGITRYRGFKPYLRVSRYGSARSYEKRCGRIWIGLC